ncbi:hypothetical protein GGG17_11100 [Arsenicicoccus sp. MKL-02]|uniref:SGNH hydrolase-type esterase domain-containing protein n=1 Tax=Arsenicicoccus cauae TaxID=2663847 RepID=A0A6I3IIM8_9MICO|nr:SGNH/GDSL hydrolase family protein [Arsenicicoccus cauae]MTB72503.1 hypothetical protein [Arsenicicoccus cauae]
MGQHRTPAVGRTTRPARLATLVAATAVGSTLAGTFVLLAAAPAQAQRPRDYVALGDSYSSGESVTPYLPGSDTAINRCHRSLRAYPQQLADSLHATTVDHGACSGAVTQDLYAPDHNGNRVTVDALEPAQLSRVDRRTDVVTLTIGGNDVGFGSILAACLYGDRQRATRTDCSTNAALTGAVAARIDALAGRGTATTPGGLPITPLRQIIADIRARSPHAKVVLGTYPQLVSSTFAGSECRVGGLTVREAPTQTVPLYVSKADAAWFAATVNRLDQVILDAPRSVRGRPARVADVRPAYGDHALCSSTTSWITPVKGTVSATTGAVSIDGSSMHPTIDGQTAYARAFRSQLR